ncbi:MAG: RHS repeat-associated core domain-containing protein, partial [Clostridia bacterium]|nr:RHS repeat-associated core domain-containing protein [Clostridia bacterium]
MVTYIYDAWGNHAVLDADGKDITDIEHIGNLNPFRYRGYYYDVETGLYFLQTRYYDPETGRFISQDSVEYAEPETVNGINLYAYCGNNPVMNIDPTGRSLIAFLLILGGILVGGVVNGLIAG